MTVIPCGREDMSQRLPDEMPYELTLPRHVGADQSNSSGFCADGVEQFRKHVSSTGHKLSEIFMADENIWQKVFK